MKAPFLFVTVLSCFTLLVSAQESDTAKIISLKEFTINENLSIGGMGRMPDINENVIYAGKKTEVIYLDKIHADLSTNNTRQVFAKVPGMSIWENDGTGIQVGVAARGLSPNRSWEFNVRQNGYDICSEVFGYPESYFSPPMEALEKIEVIRGAASLQYGPQFGGLLNYRLKKGNPNKTISYNMQQTLGSYGLFNTFHSVGGTVKKFSYYGYLHHRFADGWRDNSQYAIYTGYFSATYQLTSKISIGAEYTKMDYKSQQAGGLTDAQFAENHRQSVRERNWFSTPWNVASLTLTYAISESVNLHVKTFATLAERNSVGYTKAINIKDTINPVSLAYSPRQVDRDAYMNYGTEARLAVKYKILGKETTFAGGIRAYYGSTDRNQLGLGTNGANYDVSLTNPEYGRSLAFETSNYAAFAENIFQLGDRLKVVPGIRFDYILNTVDGYLNTSNTGTLNSEKRVRQLLLYGIGSEFKVSESTNLYGNYSLAYRPVTFSELTPSATTEIIDPNLKDASGYNADIGYRGSFKNYLNFDVGVFYMFYNNRIGTISQNGSAFKTNIGASVSQGIESYIELNLVRFLFPSSKIGNLSIFASNAFIQAKYTKWNNPALTGDPSKSIEGKRVENAPAYIHRLGATYQYKEFSVNFQLSKVGDVFTDAANTETANASATLGKLPAYQVMDASLAYKFLLHYSIKAGINNFTNEKYATRRAGGYPGPGILPGNGRTIFVTLGATF